MPCGQRGSLWQLEHLDELPNFNRKKHSIEQDYLQGVLVQMGEDVAAFEEDTKEAWEVWLPKFIKSSITNKPLQTRVCIKPGAPTLSAAADDDDDAVR